MAEREFDTDAEQKAYELGRQDGKPTDTEPLTLEQIEGMSTEEVAARLDEVNAVLVGGGEDA